MRRKVVHVAVSTAAMLASVVVGGMPANAGEGLQYNRDIRPILSENCFACHGPDSASRKANLRLDQRDAAVQLGAIEPRKPDDSELIRRICSAKRDEMMPPPSTKKQLTGAEKEKLAQWIREGAEYQLHWSLIPPTRPPLPKVKNAAWVRNPIDVFILSRLESENLQPAAEADRRTLARRVSLDLTGLPPSPALVESFVNDNSKNAYETLVDMLLQSKHWGEHRGRYWLDGARYADTHGIHFDNYREMWTYRDWVISAFNQNMPFDQFTIENLAGDLLPNATPDDLVGSGFNRCHSTTNEGGVIDEEYLVLYTRDRTEATSQVWLGLTAGCAVCHSHKFDPLSQREFYQLSAFFNNTTQGGRDGNVKDAPPIVAMPAEGDRARLVQLEPELAQKRQQVEARRKEARPDFDKWIATANADAVRAALPHWRLHFAAPFDKERGRSTIVQIDGRDHEIKLAETASWQPGPVPSTKAVQVQGAACELADVGDFEANQPFSCVAWIKVHANDSYGAVCSRMEKEPEYRGWDMWVQQRRIGMHIVSAWPNAGLKILGKRQLRANAWVHVAVTYDGSGKASGLKAFYNGEEQPIIVENDRLSGSIRTKVSFKVGQRSGGDPLSGAVINDLRIYKRALDPGEVKTLARFSRLSRILAKPANQRTGGQTDELFLWWLDALDQEYQSREKCVSNLEQEQRAIKARGTIAYVMQERKAPAMAYVLFRGDYDKRRDQVLPETPAVLPPFPKDAPRNRLGFARWLLLPNHPLTARVTVNRFWQEVFGTGIVRTTGDFGVAGELPSHQELLDWLAVEFRESGWDVKKLFKLMVTSATYRQSAAATPEKYEKDPQNRLLCRGPRFRMDAEVVRDYALAASGLLVEKFGGPSVKPYQPPGVWEAIAMDVSNTRSYVRDTGDNLYRRSLYTFWKRQAPPASMDLFNAPNREACVVRRERTDTPLQALVTLNDEQFVEAARHLAQVAAQEGGASFEGRIKAISLRLLSRELRPEEVAVARSSLDRLLIHYTKHVDEAQNLIQVGESKPDASLPAGELAAWTMLCNELMNLDEVLNK